jgi:hypothetical protein
MGQNAMGRLTFAQAHPFHKAKGTLEGLVQVEGGYFIVFFFYKSVCGL